uniref:Uncharacterized protein n=1 Tax=Timema douglasi TaxID=61478 RepID=A0A7R8VP62_TIMDO|nr:unnamed protein product [Timema douglasi]
MIRSLNNEVRISWLEALCTYSSLMASLVLTDSSQLTSDSQHLVMLPLLHARTMELNEALQRPGDMSFAGNGNGCKEFSLANIVGVEVVDGSICVDAQMEQGKAIPCGHLLVDLSKEDSASVGSTTSLQPSSLTEVECMKPQFYTPVESSVVSKDSPTENDGMRYFRVVCAQDSLPDRQGLHPHAPKALEQYPHDRTRRQSARLLPRNEPSRWGWPPSPTGNSQYPDDPYTRRSSDMEANSVQVRLDCQILPLLVENRGPQSCPQTMSSREANSVQVRLDCQILPLPLPVSYPSTYSTGSPIIFFFFGHFLPWPVDIRGVLDSSSPASRLFTSEQGSSSHVFRCCLSSATAKKGFTQFHPKSYNSIVGFAMSVAIFDGGVNQSDR